MVSAASFIDGVPALYLILKKPISSEGKMEASKEVFNDQTLEYAQSVFGIFSDEVIYIVPGGLLWSFFAFVLGIIVLVILKKKRLFNRDHKVWNLLAKLHYPIWMIVFIVAGFAYGIVNSIGSRAESILEETAKPYIEASIPVLYARLLNELPVSSPDEKITIRKASAYILKDLAYTPKSDSQFETMKSKAISWITSSVGEVVTIYAVNALVTTAIQGASRALDFSADDLEFNQTSLVDIDFSQADSSISQVVYEAIRNKLRSFMSGIKHNVYIIFGIAILLLLLEPLVHYYWRNKQLKQNQPQSIPQ